MNTVCQGFAKEKGIAFLPGSSWSFHGKEISYNKKNNRLWVIPYLLSFTIYNSSNIEKLLNIIFLLFQDLQDS